MREWLFFIASLAAAFMLAAIAVLFPPSSPLWKYMLWGGTAVFCITSLTLLFDLTFSISRFNKRAKPKINPPTVIRIIPTPAIEIIFEKHAPYEVSEISHGQILNTVRVGLKNSGWEPASNCKVYIEKISPLPELAGGLPIYLKGDFILRNDEPEKLIDIASSWGHHSEKFRFSAPIEGGFFAETLNYLDSNIPHTFEIKVQATECQRNATFRIFLDDSKKLHMDFIGYVN
jgi:hypothetical protein